jgi:hypothetical protein
LQQFLLKAALGVEVIVFTDLNNDQRREKINADQRFVTWQDARNRAASFRGSLVWHEVKGAVYLARSYYDGAGRRRQKVVGLRDRDTEAEKQKWETARSQAADRLKQVGAALTRQSAINRALRLGRVPLLSARIIRAIDDAGLLGNGIRLVGTNAIYAYESAAGVMVDAEITSTQDIDFLMDARRALRIVVDGDIGAGALFSLLRKVDKSFVRSNQTFRAVNDEGYFVDLIMPQRSPPWREERERVGDVDDELVAVAIDGLVWHESAPVFEAIAIDEQGMPVRIVTTDPRVFAAHKFWLSKQPDRDPAKRRRDESQAEAVAQLVARHLVHLPFEADELRMIPRNLFEAATPLFKVEG